MSGESSCVRERGGVRLDPLAGDGGRERRASPCADSETGAENVTEMVVFGATFCAPAAGVVDCSDERGRAGPRSP